MTNEEGLRITRERQAASKARAIAMQAEIDAKRAKRQALSPEERKAAIAITAKRLVEDATDDSHNACRR